jgi:plastocyanin
MGKHQVTAFLAGLLVSFAGAADELAIDVHDEVGGAVSDAVVTLIPADGSISPALPASAEPGRIDQSAEMFHPLVTVVRPGGVVTFTNSDQTQHHVYSFSKIKRFQFALKPGGKSPPLVFDEAGIAAIGCNIHDNMVTYVFVTAAPYVSMTDAAGHADIRSVPAGQYRASIWHPDLKAGTKPAETLIEIAAHASLTLKLAVAPKPMSSMHGMHGY